VTPDPVEAVARLAREDRVARPGDTKPAVANHRRAVIRDAAPGTMTLAEGDELGERRAVVDGRGDECHHYGAKDRAKDGEKHGRPHTVIAARSSSTPTK